MGYNLSIGNFEASVCPEERYARGDTAYTGEVEGAPLNSSGHHGAGCSPSYSVWSNFAKAVGLYSLFYAPRAEEDSGVYSSGKTVWWIDDKGEEHDGLLSRHPGAAELTEAHLRAFKAAKEKYLATPEPRSGLCQERGPFNDAGSVGVDYNLRRLDWLIFWTGWALKNCEYPTFGNS
jgi:hypothetical protein